MLGLLLLFIATSCVCFVQSQFEVHYGNDYESPMKNRYGKWIVDDLYALSDIENMFTDVKARNKCHKTFHKMVGCVKQNKYHLHGIPFQSKVWNLKLSDIIIAGIIRTLGAVARIIMSVKIMPVVFMSVNI